MKADLIAATRFFCCPVMTLMAVDVSLVTPIASLASAVVPPETNPPPPPGPLNPLVSPLFPSPGRSFVDCSPLPPSHRELRNQEDLIASSNNSLGTF